MQASVLYKIAIGTTKVHLEKLLSHFEFCEKYVFANSSYTIHLIRTKIYSDH